MEGLIGEPDLLRSARGGTFGWVNVVPPVFSVALVPALALWLPLLRNRIVLAWLLFAAATLLLARDVRRFLDLPDTYGQLPLERLVLGATIWPWAAALALTVAFRTRGRAGPDSTGARTLVVLVVFAPLLIALVALSLLPLFA